MKDNFPLRGQIQKGRGKEAGVGQLVPGDTITVATTAKAAAGSGAMSKKNAWGFAR